MKILVVTHYFWPESFRINDLVAELAQRGHRVTVLTGMPNYPGGRRYQGYGWLRPSRQEYRGATIVRHPVVTRGSGSGLRRILNYGSAAAFGALFGALFLRERFDVIFTFEPSPITTGVPSAVVRWRQRVPAVLWVQDLWPETLLATGMVKSRLILRLVAHLVRFVYRTTDLILVQSHGFLDSVQRYAPARTPIEYVPNWAEDFYRPLAPETCVAERAEYPAGFAIVFAGSIGAAQSLETMLDAAQALSADIQWIVFGDGHRADWLREQIAERGLGNRVHFLGSRPAETMPRYFAAADALFVSLRDDPIFALTIPSKLQSYLACGRPVIAVLAGEGARIVREAACGMVVSPGDGAALARAVLELRGLAPAVRSAMGARGHDYYRAHFERRRVIDRVEALLTSLARSPT
jgi:colanic acid biosynthesis glycosyl transferase WcaI